MSNAPDMSCMSLIGVSQGMADILRVGFIMADRFRQQGGGRGLLIYIWCELWVLSLEAVLLNNLITGWQLYYHTLPDNMWQYYWAAACSINNCLKYPSWQSSWVELVRRRLTSLGCCLFLQQRAGDVKIISDSELKAVSTVIVIDDMFDTCGALACLLVM